MNTDTKALFERYVEAWGSHDPDAIVALHTPDTVFHLHAGQEPAHGREAVREAFAGFLALVPDLGWEQRSLIVGDDFWVVEWRMTGTTADGKQVDADLADVVTVEDGLVKSKQSYADSITLQAQLELTEVPA